MHREGVRESTPHDWLMVREGMYTVGLQYTRRDLYELLDVPKAEQGGIG